MAKENQDEWEAARSRLLYQQRRTRRRLPCVPARDGGPGLEEYQAPVDDDDLDALSA